MPKRTNVYQFKITLKGIEPAIWRRIQVPERYNFHDLHDAIQDVMGWHDNHLHQFDMKHPQTDEKISIGKPTSEKGFEALLPERKAKITEYFVNVNDKAVYEYDFGDQWQHDVVLEQIMPSEAKVKYPRCTAGERACPPEDCGGIRRYEELLKLLADPDPNQKTFKKKMDWLDFIGQHDFDPEYFELDNVHFGL